MALLLRRVRVNGSTRKTLLPCSEATRVWFRVSSFVSDRSRIGTRICIEYGTPQRTGMR